MTSLYKHGGWHQRAKKIQLTLLADEGKKSRPPPVPHRRVINLADKTGLRLTLYQYESCPFCCKVRAMLDYYGLSYDIVEVDTLKRTQIKWSAYKKSSHSCT
ncbi:hypothetical protein LSAT2_023606 [Lamellibrachia satsuma]|nr:hypothetical protein LSAT2_023606 [Lamellibrachia satsuma]